MLDKISRLQSTVTKLSLAMGVNEDKLQIVQEAASLAMSDLATSVVTEFTSLAGIMGRHYALRDGYPEQVNFIHSFCKDSLFARRIFLLCFFV